MIINYSDEDVLKEGKSIFLAGPTPRSESVPSWRGEACRILESLGFTGTVYVPEFSSWKPREDYTAQAMWERIALTNATVIVFWIPRSMPDMPAFTTNVEFGYWMHTGKIVYGRPDDSIKKSYLDWLYGEDYAKEPYNNLEDLLKAAIAMTDILYDGRPKEILPVRERKILK